MRPVINTYLNPEISKEIQNIENDIIEKLDKDEIDKKEIAELRKKQIYAGLGLGLGFNPNTIYGRRYK